MNSARSAPGPGWTAGALGPTIARMKDQGLSDKELALIQAARREAAAKKAAAAGPAAAPPAAAKSAAPRRAAKPAGTASPVKSARPSPAATTPLKGRTVVGWDHPAAKPKPAAPIRLDAPTVAGWDHPAAQGAAPADAAKWERIAALMEAEREETRERHRRAQRGAVIFLGILFLLVLFAGVKVLAR